jgi:putative transposase
MSYFSRITIRDAILPSESELTEETKWQKEIPYDTKQFAIDQCMAAYQSNFALKKNGHIDTFDVKYKTKKSSQTFQINKKAINFDKFLIFQKRIPKKFKVRKRDIEKLKAGADGTVTMLITKSRKYYLCIPRTKEQTYEPSPFKSVFLDPGERTFMTYYSPDGICGKIGDSYSRTYIEPLLKKIDKFESLRATCDNKVTKYRMKIKLFKLWDKAKNRVNDLHWKTCNYLCNTFQTIFLPEFKVSEMVEKTPKRVISKKTVRNLLQLSHCEFRNRLIYYATTKHRQVVIVSEAYTTKTCGNCGCIKDVGAAKVFSCKCGYTMDRDYHGARNLSIRCLS